MTYDMVMADPELVMICSCWGTMKIKLMNVPVPIRHQMLVDSRPHSIVCMDVYWLSLVGMTVIHIAFLSAIHRCGHS
jgi:hypothetical protein